MKRRTFFEVLTGIGAATPLAKALKRGPVEVPTDTPAPIREALAAESGALLPPDRPGMLCVTESALYDRFCVQGDLWPYAQYPVRLFMDPIGPDRGFMDTNMQLSARLPDPQEFHVERIAICFDSGTDQDIEAVCQFAVLRLLIGRRVYLERVLSAFRTKPTDLVYDVVESTPREPLRWAILPGMSFHGELILEPFVGLSAPVYGYCVLEGIKVVPIQ